MAKEVKIANNSYVLNHDGKTIVSITTPFRMFMLGESPYDGDAPIRMIHIISADEHHVWFRMDKQVEDEDEIPPVFVLHKGEYEIRSVN